MAEIEHRDGEAVIVTPVGSALSRIEGIVTGGFARVETALAGKADKGDIVELRTTLREHGDRLSVLERDRNDRAAAERASRRLLTRRQAFLAALIGVGAIASPVVVALVQH